MAEILYLFVPLAVVVIVAAVADRRRRHGLGGREISEEAARAISDAKAAVPPRPWRR